MESHLCISCHSLSVNSLWGESLRLNFCHQLLWESHCSRQPQILTDFKSHHHIWDNFVWLLSALMPKTARGRKSCPWTCSKQSKIQFWAERKIPSIPTAQKTATEQRWLQSGKDRAGRLSAALRRKPRGRSPLMSLPRGSGRKAAGSLNSVRNDQR